MIPSGVPLHLQRLPERRLARRRPRHPRRRGGRRRKPRARRGSAGPVPQLRRTPRTRCRPSGPGHPAMCGRPPRSRRPQRAAPLPGGTRRPALNAKRGGLPRERPRARSPKDAQRRDTSPSLPSETIRHAVPAGRGPCRATTSRRREAAATQALLARGRRRTPRPLVLHVPPSRRPGRWSRLARTPQLRARRHGAPEADVRTLPKCRRRERQRTCPTKPGETATHRTGRLHARPRVRE